MEQHMMASRKLGASGRDFLSMLAVRAPQQERLREELRVAQQEAQRLEAEAGVALGEAEARRQGVAEAVQEQAQLLQRLEDVKLGYAGYQQHAARGADVTQRLRARQADAAAGRKAFVRRMEGTKAVLRTWEGVHALEVAAQEHVRQCAEAQAEGVLQAVSVSLGRLTCAEQLGASRAACEAHLEAAAGRYEPLRNEWMAARMASEEALVATRVLEGRADEAGLRAEAVAARVAACADEAQRLGAEAEAQEAGLCAAGAAVEAAQARVDAATQELAREQAAAVQAREAAAQSTAAAQAEVEAVQQQRAQLANSAEAAAHEADRAQVAEAEEALQQKLLRVLLTAEMHVQLRMRAAAGELRCVEVEHQAHSLQAELDAVQDAQTQGSQREGLLRQLLAVAQAEAAAREGVAAQWEGGLAGLERSANAENGAIARRDFSRRRERLASPTQPVSASGHVDVDADPATDVVADGDRDMHRHRDRTESRQSQSQALLQQQLQQQQQNRQKQQSRKRDEKNGSHSRDPPRKRTLSGNAQLPPSKSPRQSQPRRDAFDGLFSASARRPDSGGALSDISSLFRETPHQPKANNKSLTRKTNAFAGL